MSQALYADVGQAVLTALVRAVRMFTPDQVARGFFSNDATPLASAERLLSRLARRGLLEFRTVRAAPDLGLTTPLCSWKPGEPTPNDREVSRRARARWKNPAVPQRVAGACQRF